MMRLKSVTTLAATAALLTMSAGAFAASVPPILNEEHQSGDAASECAQVGTYECALKIDSWGSIDPNMNGVYLAEQCPTGVFNEITISNDDGSSFDFSSSYSIGAVVVKGGPGANYYVYDPQVPSDTLLMAPVNSNNNEPFDVSHATFCWNYDPRFDECLEWEGETAWSAGYRYSDERGNWATYTQLSEALALEDGVDIFAGRTIYVGKAKFALTDDPELVTITITLEGARFALDEEGEPVEENLKIQGYNDEAPTGNPAPGQFTTSKTTESGTSATVTVPYFDFYGVHLDVEVSVECEADEEEEIVVATP